METIYINPDDIYPFRVSHFNTLEEKFFSLKSDTEQPLSLDEVLKETFKEKLFPNEKGLPLADPILTAHVSYVTKGNLRTSIHEFRMPCWIFKMYVPKENGGYLVPSSTLVSDWDSLIKDEYPNLEYVALEDFWNLFSNNQIQYKEFRNVPP